jgi:hypothetical protein
MLHAPPPSLSHSSAWLDAQTIANHFKSAVFRSPNGQWIAQAEHTVCGGRFIALGSASTEVSLRRDTPTYLPNPVTILSAAGADMDEKSVGIHWTSNYQLQLTSPIDSNIDTLMASARGIDISLTFIPQDPEERARVVSHQREVAEWTAHAIGPAPK